ncbi:hypothetical protein [Limosilactobacillus kribbianus]|uniref:hypothetical protein n=1 Tax=Limosilactobacillus kribbianus TaxID=2982695 RepID=UPI002263D082|nr:hypothetical protein [Limosilactobacillus kribbianus]
MKSDVELIEALESRLIKMADIDFMQETVRTMLNKNVRSYSDKNEFLSAHGLNHPVSAEIFNDQFVASGELVALRSTTLRECGDFITSVALTHHPGSDLPLYHIVATELTEHPIFKINHRYWYQAATIESFAETIARLNHLQAPVQQ